jgi:putative hydrolase of the HAD superfamily
MSHSNPAEIRALILDYGEVLCHRPTPDQLRQMAQLGGLDEGTLMERYFRERGPYDRGDLAPFDYWSRVVADSIDLSNGVLASLQKLDVEMWSDLKPEMIRWLGDTRAAGLKTAVLSNMPADMACHVRQSFDWLKGVDCVVLSCEVRRIKPEPEIYDRCIEGIGLPAEAALFIDDRATNVEAARKAGLMSLQFQTVEGLRKDLTDIGFPILPKANTLATDGRL